MEYTQEQLDQWRRCLACIRDMSRDAEGLLDKGDAARVRDLLRDIHAHAVQIGYRLEQAGATPAPEPTC